MASVALYSYDQTDARCAGCGHRFNPQQGPARRTTFVCEQCAHEHPIAVTYRRPGIVPQHQMYALPLLLPDGRKTYKQPDQDDLACYQAAAAKLRQSRVSFPKEEIPPGFNTDQARGYNYHYWHQMFNERQLY